VQTAQAFLAHSIDGVEIAHIRAEGPAALDRLLALYDTSPREARAMRLRAVSTSIGLIDVRRLRADGGER
jgi:hypothetical protein